MRLRTLVPVLAAALAFSTALPAHAFDDTWTKVASGTLGGVSGLAVADSGWVIVRDNKLPGQNRVALLDDTGLVTPLSWPGTAPQDLESIAPVPGSAGEYATLTSKGAGQLISISGTTLSVLRTFTVPKGTSNIEAFALLPVGSTTVALWATRGATTRPARLFGASFDPATGAFGRTTAVSVTVPYPTTNVRQISDLTLSGNRIISAASSDGGVNGPFDSAVYDLGTVSSSGATVVLTMHAPTMLATYPGHKAEGVACAGSSGLVGSDDEKQGGWVRTDSICG